MHITLRATNAKKAVTVQTVQSAAQAPPGPSTSYSVAPSVAVTRRNALFSSVVCTFGSCIALPKSVRAETAAAPSDAVNDLAFRAVSAYRDKQLPEALALYTQIIELERDNPVWYERRGQVKVDLDNKAFPSHFQDAVEDFDRAEALQPPNFVSLGLLSNRALAYEGLADWRRAVEEYTKVLTLSQEVGGTPPYVLNSRGNCYVSMGDWEAARADYRNSAATFQRARNLSGAVFASSNAALMLVQLGQRAEGTKEIANVARRAPGSTDMRAALAALYWAAGEADKAESVWQVACGSINSGVMVEGGSALDGCERYRDSDWLERIRRWPPVMVDLMSDFVGLKAPGTSAALRA